MNSPKYCIACGKELITADEEAYDRYTGKKIPRPFLQCPLWDDPAEYKHHDRYQLLPVGRSRDLQWVDIGQGPY